MIDILARLFLFLAYLLTSVKCLNYTLPRHEVEALQALYNSTHGEFWAWKYPTSIFGPIWNFSEPIVNPCDSWQGVVCNSTCATEPCTVTELLLSEYNLVGTIPKELGQLTNLEQFGLTYNTNLTGTIPPELSTLSGLQTFFLNDNSLHGKIPDIFKNWLDLEEFYVDYNRLSGSLPSSLGYATKLKLVWFGENMLDGSIPVSFGNLTSLVEFTVFSNYLTGSLPSFFGNCHKLEYFYLYDNFFDGEVPTEYQSMSSLVYLVLYTNLLHGTIPEELSTLPKLEVFYGDYNYFTGKIPTSFSNLPSLYYLYLYSNQLTGTVPNNIGEFPSILEFIVGLNYLNGTVPSGNISSLTMLVEFSVGANLLTGSIPEDIEHWRSLEWLYLYENSLEGSIPAGLGRLGNLTELELYNNELTGTIPSELGSCMKLLYLYLAQNRLRGPIPREIGNLRFLSTLSVERNLLTGTVPLEIFNLTKMSQLALYDNFLNGSIPAQVQQLKDLTAIIVSYNYFTGTIPPELGQLKKVLEIGLYNNLFDGPIPEELTSCDRMFELLLGNNYLTGTILPNLGRMTALIQLDLSNNLLSGEIPETFTYLSGLDLSGNRLNGTIPHRLFTSVTAFLSLEHNLLTGDYGYFLTLDSLSNSVLVDANQLSGPILSNSSTQPRENEKPPAVQYMNISLNYFTGTLSENVSKLRNMIQLLIGSNYFSGSLSSQSFSTMGGLTTFQCTSNLMDGSIPSDLLAFTNSTYFILDLDDNSFTGTLSSELFGVGILQSFVSSLNCLSGTLPSSVCANGNLVELLLDGLHAASVCSSKTFSFVSNSGYLLSSTAVHGSIPDCVWGLLQLESLHLSGNNFDGMISLSSDVADSSTGLGTRLRDLGISHNAFTGSVPSAIWTHNFSNLDLSFNRFYGTIPNDISSYNSNTTNLTLQVNRFSGYIPSSLFNAPNIIVLTGNMFDCGTSSDSKDSRRPLPIHDPAYSSFQCGSKYTDSAMIMYAVYALSLLLLVLVVVYGREFAWSRYFKDLWRRIKEWSDIFGDIYVTEQKAFANIRQFYLLKSQIDRWLLVLVLFVLFAGIPLYVVLTFVYGTYRPQYIWTVSAGYLSGRGASACLLVFFLLVLEMMLSTKRILLMSRLEETWASFWHRQSSMLSNIKWRRFTVNVVFIVTSTVIVLLVNGAYVLAITEGFGTIKLLTVVTALSLFKIVWSNVCNMFYQNLYSDDSYTVSLIGLMIFNNIMAPYLAESVISPDCFKYAISRPPLVTASAISSPCYIINTLVDVQTSSGITVTNVYGITCLPTNTFPSNVTILQTFSTTTTTSYYPAFAYNFQCSSSVMAAFVYVFILRYAISSILVPLAVLGIKYVVYNYLVKYGMPSNVTGHWLYWLSCCLPRTLRLCLLDESMIRNHAQYDKEIRSITNWNNVQLQQIMSTPLNTAQMLRVHIVRDLAIMLTFGVIFPPLMFIIAVAIVVEVQMTTLSIGRFVLLRKLLNEHVHVLDGVLYDDSSSNPIHALTELLNPVSGIEEGVRGVKSQKENENSDRTISVTAQQMLLGRKTIRPSSSTPVGETAVMMTTLTTTMRITESDRTTQQQREVEEEDTKSFEGKEISSVAPLSQSQSSIGGQTVMSRTMTTMVRFSSATTTTVLLDLLLQKVEESMKLFGIKIWRGFYISTCCAAVFWSFTLFDTLGDTEGALGAVWIVLLLGLSPMWLPIVNYFIAGIRSVLLPARVPL